MDANELAPLAAAVTPPKRGRGRPVGSKNYCGNSFIARTFKRRGVDWVEDLISAYLLYKKQLAETGAADPSLLHFWQEIIPYIALPMIEKEQRKRERPKRKPRNGISPHSLALLAKAEAGKA